MNMRIDQSHTRLLWLEKTSHLREVFRGCHNEMLIDAKSIEIFVEVEVAAIHFTDLSSGSF